MTAVSLTLGLILPGPTESTRQQATFSASVDVVRVDALVTEGRLPLLGLQAADFEVLDEGVPQTITGVSFEQVPLNIVVALDVSGSVTGVRLTQLRAAAGGVVDALRPNDRIAMLTFGFAVSLRTPLTSDAVRVRAALAEPFDAGETSLIDAAYSAIAVGDSDIGRNLVMILSDGDDTSSFLSAASVLETARRSDAVVYAVLTGAPGARAFLGDLTDATGGRVLNAAGDVDLGGQFLAILNEFRQRYLISYTPRGVAKGGWHRLEVRVKNRRAVVNARRGYLAGS